MASEAIELVGVERLNRTVKGMGERMGNMLPLLVVESERLEAMEEEHFGALGGKYVATGRLRDSLTTSGASDAVRRATLTTLEFGSEVPYAKFQVIDPGPVTPAGGLERRGHKSAVLVLSEETGHAIARDMMRRIMGDFE